MTHFRNTGFSLCLLLPLTLHALSLIHISANTTQPTILSGTPCIVSRLAATAP